MNGWGVGQLQRNKVIDIHKYRDDTAREQGGAGALDELPAGTVLLHGQYTITEYLNSGGFGITYRAKDSLGRPVVLKECFPSIMCVRRGTDVLPRNKECAEELRKMIGNFVSEAHSLAALQHKNIVHVHQVFEENETAYMAIDFIDGLDLQDIMERTPEAMTVDEIVRITKHTLPAIKYIHSKDLLHRDISPDNILIDQSGEPILIDFGAARKKAKSSSRAFSKMRFVKDGYSPQEFYIDGAEQGPYSDLYSFAATVYHLITGAAPEDGQKRLSALAQKEADPYVPLAGRFPGYPRGFLAAIDDALIIVPQKRLQSADEWLSRLVARPSRREGPPTKTPNKVLLPVAKAPALPKVTEAEAEVRNSLKQAAAPTAGRGVGLLIAAVILALLAGASVLAFNRFTVDDVRNVVREAAIVQPETGGLTREAISENSEPVLSPLGSGIETTLAIERSKLPRVVPVAMDTVRDGLMSARMPVQSAERAVPEVAGRMAETPTQPPRGSRPEPKFLDEIKGGLSALPPPRIAALQSDVAPTVAIPDAAKSSFFFQAPENGSLALTLDVFAAPVPPREAVTIFAPVVGDTVNVIANPPVPPVAEKPILLIESARPHVAAHWDVEMPFESTSVQVRKATTIEVGAILDRAVLEKSGDWVSEGTVIFTFNGETLREDLSLSGHILSHPKIDPDGFVRATVRYRAPDTGRIDRGLLAIPVTRQIALSDGTLMQARVEDMVWVTRVVDPGSSDFHVGDRLVSELQTNVAIRTEVGIETVIDGLAATGAEFAEFQVIRNGETRVVTVALDAKRDGERQ